MNVPDPAAPHPAAPGSAALSRVALWSLVAALSGILCLIALMNCVGPALSPLVFIACALLALVATITAIGLGHAGIDRTSRRQGGRGRCLAECGLVIGYVLIPVGLYAVILTGGMELERQKGLTAFSMGELAQAKGCCDLIYARSLTGAGEFSCARVEAALDLPQGVSVRLTPSGGSCRIEATVEGWPPFIETWSFRP